MKFEKHKSLFILSIVSFFLILAFYVFPGAIKIVFIIANIIAIILYYVFKFSKKIKVVPFLNRYETEIDEKISMVKTIISREKATETSQIFIRIIDPENDNDHVLINGIKLSIKINQNNSNELLLPLNDNFTKNDSTSFEYLIKRQMENWKR